MGGEMRGITTSVRLSVIVLVGLGFGANTARAQIRAAVEPRPNFDVRDDETKESRTTLERHLAKYGSALAGKREAGAEALRSAERALKTARPDIEVRISPRTGTAEIVGIGRGAGKLGPAVAGREAALRGFLGANAGLFGMSSAQIGAMKKTADYTNPNGNMSWVRLERQIQGLDVFRGEVSGAFSRSGDLVQTIGELPGGIDDADANPVASVSAADAVAAAARSIGMSLAGSDLRVKSVSPDGNTVVFETGPFTEEVKAQKMFFPLGYGAVEVAWFTHIWRKDEAYMAVVGGEIPDVLFRKSILDHQTQPVTYKVYASDSPSPLSPTTAIPGSATQPPLVARTTFTFVSELPAFDNLGWIDDGGNVTTGNNVDAGLDIDGTNGIDPTGRATGSPARTFDFTYTPEPGPGAVAPSDANFRLGAVTNIFFWSNRYHDILYQYGFTEAARNFQNNNFGRGGLGADFVRAEAQDSSGTDNANFATPADGSLPRMQMFIFPDSTTTLPRDGDLDGDVHLHELTHGTSNRLHSNASGLTATQSRGMGEGWSDFYGRCILSDASENVNGVFAMGGYVTKDLVQPFTDNYYYGIRRFPYAVKTNTGGSGNLPHNPLTYADIDTAQLNLSDGAYPMNPLPIFGAANEVHNIGEVWAMMLFEVRARIIGNLGFAAGNQRALQIVTDGMKLDPVAPILLDARNSILTADCTGFAGADEMDIWNGFATRGLGFGATSAGTSTVTESFALPNLTTGAITFSDSACNANGFADPNENLTFTVPLTNPFCASSATTTTATIGSNTANYGTIAGGATVSQPIAYHVPAATVCGSQITIPIQINSSLGAVTRNYVLTIGQPVVGFTEAFDTVVAPALPVGWTTAFSGSLPAWVTSATNPDSAPNDAFAPDTATVGNTELISPAIPITSAAAQLTFRNLFNMEAGTAPTGFDGTVLEISIGGGPYQDILAAGGSFVSGGYNRTISGSFASPIANRQAWSGLSAGTTAAPAYITTVVNLPAAANGQNVQLKWRTATDSSAIAAGVPGVRIDGISIVAGYSCAPTTCTPVGLTGFDAE